MAAARDENNKLKTNVKIETFIKNIKKACSVIAGIAAVSAGVSANAGVSYFNVSWYTDFKGKISAQGNSSTTYLTAISADWKNISGSAPLPPNHGDPFVTFCLDFNNTLASGWWKSGGFADTALNGQSSPAVRQNNSLFRAANLYSQYANGVLGAFNSSNSAARQAARIEGAALQLAIWEVLYEPNPSDTTAAYNVLSEGAKNKGFVVTSANSAITTRANQMLSAASVADFGLENTFWNAVTDSSGMNSRSSQDLIGPFAPVPEPSTYFAGALLCLPVLVNAIRARKRQQA